MSTRDEERLLAVVPVQSTVSAHTDESESSTNNRGRLLLLLGILVACLVFTGATIILRRPQALAPLTVHVASTGSLESAADEQGMHVPTGDGSQSSSEPAGASEARRLTETASTCTIGRQSSFASGGRKLDLNAATVAELDALPGIGQVLASRIIAWRTAHRGFTTIHELQEVEGIGPAKFARLCAQVDIR